MYMGLRNVYAPAARLFCSANMALFETRKEKVIKGSTSYEINLKILMGRLI